VVASNREVSGSSCRLGGIGGEEKAKARTALRLLVVLPVKGLLTPGHDLFELWTLKESAAGPETGVFCVANWHALGRRTAHLSASSSFLRPVIHPH
jgi:hypothetical protein